MGEAVGARQRQIQSVSGQHWLIGSDSRSALITFHLIVIQWLAVRSYILVREKSNLTVRLTSWSTVVLVAMLKWG